MFSGADGMLTGEDPLIICVMLSDVKLQYLTWPVRHRFLAFWLRSKSSKSLHQCILSLSRLVISWERKLIFGTRGGRFRSLLRLPHGLARYCSTLGIESKTRGKVLSWEYRSPRKRNSRPPQPLPYLMPIPPTRFFITNSTYILMMQT